MTQAGGFPSAGYMGNGGAMPNLPPGINSATDSNPGTGTQAANVVNPVTNKGTFAPPFRMGLGKSGVFSDPRQQIAGGPSADLAAPAQTQQNTTGNSTDIANGASSSAGNIGSGGAMTPPAAGNGSQLPYDPNMYNSGGETAQQNQAYLNSLGPQYNRGG